jgi:hypothetical protein
VACPALDSIVENFNSNPIGTTVGGGDPRTITNVISDVYYAATDRAEQTGFEGADGGSELDWGFIMRKEMFRALTDVYANTYATSRFQANSLSAGTPLLQDGQRTNDLRVEMLNGKYLIVEGQPIPIFFSDGMPLTPARQQHLRGRSVSWTHRLERDAAHQPGIFQHGESIRQLNTRGL